MAKASVVIPRLLHVLDMNSTYELEDMIGLNGMPIYKLISRDSELSITMINYLLATFPDLNPSFLVTGKGPVMMDGSLKKLLEL